MKTFQQFITEAELKDKEGLGHGTGLTHRGGETVSYTHLRAHET